MLYIWNVLNPHVKNSVHVNIITIFNRLKMLFIIPYIIKERERHEYFSK